MVLKKSEWRAACPDNFRIKKSKLIERSEFFFILAFTSTSLDLFGSSQKIREAY